MNIFTFFLMFGVVILAIVYLVLSAQGQNQKQNTSHSNPPNERLSQIVSQVLPENTPDSAAAGFLPKNNSTIPCSAQPLVLNTPHSAVLQSSKPDEINVRLEKIENLLLNNGNSILAYNLKEKLRKLDNFRANTEVEIAGIREILAELQKDQGQKISATRKTTEEDTGLVTEDMRKIIYRARS